MPTIKHLPWMPINAEVTIPPIEVSEPSPRKTLIDDVGGGVTYVGEANPGTATSASAWRIKRLTEVGADINVEWADGVNTYTKEWDERLTYTYS